MSEEQKKDEAVNAAPESPKLSSIILDSMEAPKYTKKELIAGFRALGTAKAVVVAALEYYGIESTSIEEAKKAVQKFLEREVR